MADREFTLYTPITFFEKAEAPDGERRRFAGLITTESVDQEDEVVIQKGLDFSQFINSGYFNDNHSKKQTDVLGFPLDVRFVRKGEALPDGRISPADGHWAEGALIEGYSPAEQVWNLGKALQKTARRRLGFSIEGKILRRAGPSGKHIARANVSHVAITHCPVNTDTYFVTLAKALRDAAQDISEEEKREEEEKAFTVGGGPVGEGVAGRKPIGPVTGEGAGRITTPESLESKAANPWAGCTAGAGRGDKDKYESCVQGVKEDIHKAWAVLEQRGVDVATVRFDTVMQFIEVTRELKRAHVI